MIEVRNMARVVLPQDDYLKQTILGMFSYQSRNGVDFYNYMYSNGVAFLPPNMDKLKVVAALLNEEIVDRRAAGNSLSSPFCLRDGFQFRGYQQEPADEFVRGILRDRAGTLSAGCGTGKTIVMAYAGGMTQRKQLVLIDQSNLIDNWEKAYKLIWGREVQKLDSSTTEFSDVCISTFQLLHRNRALLDRIRTEFGTTIVDEAHGVKAETFKQVLLRLNNQYRLGCSATFFVKGLPVGILEDLVGPILTHMEDPNALTAKVHFVETGTAFASDNPMDFASKTLRELAGDQRRNAIVFSLVRDCIAAKRKTVVICIKEDQAKFLDALTRRVGGRSIVYTGSTSAKQNKMVKDKMSSGELDVMFVCKKLDKGFDCEPLDCLIQAKPNNNRRDTEQQSGRVVRQWEGKPQPLVYDLLDQGELAKTFARNRFLWYGDLGYEFETVPDFFR